MPDKPCQSHYVVVVLGDVGRSPRMQYHALSLVEKGHFVTLVGYDGEDLIEALQEKQNSSDLFSSVRFHVPDCPTLLGKVGLRLIWRIITMSVFLLYALFGSVPKAPEVECILVQNPPAIPLLSIAWFFARIKGLTKSKRPRLVIDWHNLQHSFFGGVFHKIVRVYETKMAQYADGHLCVTTAMKGFLQKEMKLDENNISVLYDCPPSMFRPLSLDEQHQTMLKLNQELLKSCPRAWNLPDGSSQSTILTAKVSDTKFEPRHGRPALVTSSTSWTPDEDFGLLLDALVMLEERISLASSPLKILLVVTGKGPQKTMYEKKISQLKMASVAVQTVWLQPGDYPRLLACADVGVSLHTSTSSHESVRPFWMQGSSLC